MQPDKIIQRISVRIDIRRILLSLGWWLLWGISIFQYMHRHEIDPQNLLQFQWIWTSIIFILPFPCFGLWKTLRDRSWDGIVVRKKVGQIYATKRGRYLGDHGEDAEFVWIKKPNGKLFVMTFWGKNILSAEYYEIGDKVHHYKNLPFCEKHDKRESSKQLCVFCGNLSPADSTHCFFCWKHLPKRILLS